MRVYVPTTFAGLRELAATRTVPAGAPAVAVTPAFRESYASGDTEELEYAALSAAARLSADLGGRRAVLACEVAGVGPEEPDRPGHVTTVGEVPIADVKAVHVDEPDADPEEELLWYATQELDDLLSGRQE